MSTGERSHEDTAVCKPGRDASGETSPADTLISDFKPPGCETINFCCLSCPVCGALLADSCRLEEVTHRMCTPGTPALGHMAVREACAGGAEGGD